MIKTHSDDPNVAEAAAKALQIINDTLAKLPKAEVFDYGGHNLKLGEYDVCTTCTTPIAEAQAAQNALHAIAEQTTDETMQEHLQLASEFFRQEAEEAVLRAEFHNGHGTEPILDRLLGYQFERGIHDDYHHSHDGGAGQTNSSAEGGN
jgi:flavin-binding protein dodecin